MPRTTRVWVSVPFLVMLTSLTSQAAGPKVPEGFEARLVAQVPAVEFPSQVATAPDGSLFVAEDPMDQRGPYEAFDARILRLRAGREPIRFVDGFRAIQGMAWRDGSLYVCHMPFLTIEKLLVEDLPEPAVRSPAFVAPGAHVIHRGFAAGSRPPRVRKPDR